MLFKAYLDVKVDLSWDFTGKVMTDRRFRMQIKAEQGIGAKAYSSTSSADSDATTQRCAESGGSGGRWTAGGDRGKLASARILGRKAGRTMAVMSRTTQYALYALSCVQAAEGQGFVLARDIAEHKLIPANYLAKVLRALVRAGILESARGRSGGFRLARRLDDVPLMELRELFEGPWVNRRCVLGLGRCNAESPCAAHHNWSPIAATIEGFLAGTTVADILSKPIDPAREAEGFGGPDIAD
jgi:Rrf2 family protein